MKKPKRREAKYTWKEVTGLVTPYLFANELRWVKSDLRRIAARKQRAKK